MCVRVTKGKFENFKITSNKLSRSLTGYFQLKLFFSAFGFAFFVVSNKNCNVNITTTFYLIKNPHLTFLRIILTANKSKKSVLKNRFRLYLCKRLLYFMIPMILLHFSRNFIYFLLYYLYSNKTKKVGI